MGKKKKLAVYQHLGQKSLRDDSVDDLFPEYMAAYNLMKNEAGGGDAWDNLTEIEQNERKAAMLTNLTIDLGKKEFEKLSAKEQSMFKLFVWAGCGCHKDLNTVLGGYAAMQRFWVENNLEPPVILPNKHNAAIIDEDAEVDDDPSEAALRAVKSSTRGAVKAAKIAGDILNNKNDKAGHHDDFRIWWKAHFGEQMTFPGTSNNRFGSNCNASTVLTMKRQGFIDYMDYALKKKSAAKRTNMEENFVKALNDVPTRTEFAVLAIYAQAVSYPYMQTIRGNPSTNALDLGPLNRKISSFIERVINDPSFLIGPHVTYKTGTFNGEPWYSEDVVNHINQLEPELPHLKPAIVAFFKGALESWKRFTSEYAIGGLIDEATQEEKDMAWMPPTNDVNEGALGGFRVALRRQPQLTLLQYNARTMFARNNTAEFVKEHFSDDTHKYVCKLAREKDTREKDRLLGIVEHNESRIQKKEAQKKKCEDRATQAAARIATIELNFNKDEIDKMKGDTLRDHFVAFKEAGAPMPNSVKRSSKVGELKDAIKGAIDSYKKREWTSKYDLQAPSDIEEEEEEEEIEWTDTSGISDNDDQ